MLRPFSRWRMRLLASAGRIRAPRRAAGLLHMPVMPATERSTRLSVAMTAYDDAPTIRRAVGAARAALRTALAANAGVT